MKKDTTEYRAKRKEYEVLLKTIYSTSDPSKRNPLVGKLCLLRDELRMLKYPK